MKMRWTASVLVPMASYGLLLFGPPRAAVGDEYVLTRSPYIQRDIEDEPRAWILVLGRLEVFLNGEELRTLEWDGTHYAQDSIEFSAEPGDVLLFRAYRPAERCGSLSEIWLQSRDRGCRTAIVDGPSCDGCAGSETDPYCVWRVPVLDFPENCSGGLEAVLVVPEEVDVGEVFPVKLVLTNHFTTDDPNGGSLVGRVVVGPLDHGIPQTFTFREDGRRLTRLLDGPAPGSLIHISPGQTREIPYELLAIRKGTARIASSPIGVSARMTVFDAAAYVESDLVRFTGGITAEIIVAPRKPKVGDPVRVIVRARSENKRVELTEVYMAGRPDLGAGEYLALLSEPLERVALMPGQAHDFVFEYQADNAGVETISPDIVARAGEYSIPVDADMTQIEITSGLEATFEVIPRKVRLWGDIAASLTVRNQGEGTYHTLVPTLVYLDGATGGLGEIAGTSPDPADTLGPQEQVVFRWQFVPFSPGFVPLNARVEAINEETDETETVSGDPITVEILPDLIAAIEIDPKETATDQAVTVTLVAENAGSSTITDLSPSLEYGSEDGGEVTRLSGPMLDPPGKTSLDPGEKVRFSYEYETESEGTVRFSGRVDGTDELGREVSSNEAEDTLVIRNITFDWTMPPRLADEDGDGIIDHYMTEDEILLRDGLDVELRISKGNDEECDPDLEYTWEKDGTAWMPDQDGDDPCLFRANFEHEGSYEITLMVNGYEAVTKEVIVQDWLIVSIGDSVASGEGNPDVAAGGGSPAVWQDEQCHRSARAGSAQAALAIEKSDDRTSVTFVHLACSGATIYKGLIGPYFGIVPGASPSPSIALPSQVSELRRLVGEREIDAMIVSIGANDVGFGPISTFCALYEQCMTQGFNENRHVRFHGLDLMIPAADPDSRPLQEQLFNRFAELLSRYDSLAARLRPVVDPERVYFTQYYDPTRDENAQFCDRMLDLGMELLGLDIGYARGITSDEAEFAYEQIVRKLNMALDLVAGRYGWKVVPGIESSTARHGYCAQGGAKWVVTLKESYLLQGDFSGPLHPNPWGHENTAVRITERLLVDFYGPDGSGGALPRKPRPRDGTTLTEPADPGDIVLRVHDTDGFFEGGMVELNPGERNSEIGTIAGLGSIILEAPLEYHHDAGEAVVPYLPPSPDETPITMITVSPEPNGQGWYNTDVTIQMHSEDDPYGSGIDSLYYAIDRPDCSTGHPSGCMALSGDPGKPFIRFQTQEGSEGRHTLRCFAMDRAGNVEPVNERDIYIDRTPPTTTTQIETSLDGISVSLAAEDNLSGVESTEYKVDEAAWEVYSAPIEISVPGPHEVYYRSTDRAGNQEQVQQLSLDVPEEPGDDCPDDPDKTEPGICGCGVPDTDSDQDGTADCRDNCIDTPNPEQADSDGDGIGDACEPERVPCDLDMDGDIDRTDLIILMGYRNQVATVCPGCDVDGDGRITVLDARKCVLECTRPRCATE